MEFALSCSWNAFRHRSGRKTLFEIKKLGFEAVELSFNLTPHMLSGIKSYSGQSGLKIVSVHNFCPIPGGWTRKEGLPDCYSMASRDRRQRRLALEHTKRSIDTACLLGAKAVIIHCGRVEMPDRTRVLIGLRKKYGKNCRKLKGLRDSFIRRRQSLSRPFFENALASLGELNRYARAAGIILGVENRFYYREIPTLEELGLIFKEFRSPYISYWHDTGHAQVMQELGIGRHKDYLDRYASRMAGIHLHDVSGCRDHLAPGTGSLDFSFLKPYLKKETIKVIEAHHPASAEDIIRSRVVLWNSLK